MMTSPSPTRVGMSLDDYLEQSNEHPFELIDGERIDKLPNIAGHSDLVRALFVALYLYVRSAALGEVYEEATFILPDRYDSSWVRGARLPDVLFFAAERVSDYKAQIPDWRTRPFMLVPDLVAEVVSPTDRYTDVNHKVEVYLQDGVRLVWVIDPQMRTAVVYAAGTQPQHLTSEDTLSGGEVIPGFAQRLGDLFA